MASVSIFGLGYVGSVVTGCLAENGHCVVGVDVNRMKTEWIASGRSPIKEKGLEDLLRKGLEKGAVRATTDPRSAVLETDISLVCVGTPSNDNGSTDLRHVIEVSEQVGDALRSKSAFHVIAVRSTVPPGATENVVIPAVERSSGKKHGVDFGVCFNPEFLREGTSVPDFYDPPLTVIGTDHQPTATAVAGLYSMLTAPLKVVPFKSAEMLKYANNSFHALKTCFANEIGNICRKLDIDSHQVMEMFCMDRKLNLSSNYLKPGFAFGGSCLPKDVRALTYLSRRLDLSSPVLESILPSNARQVEIACHMIEAFGRRRVGICGLSFKAGTDDLRESPMVRLIEFLIGKGYPVKIYDEDVSISRLHGANRAYIEQVIPHIGCLMVDFLDEVIGWSDVLVINSNYSQVKHALTTLPHDQQIIDLVRVDCDVSSWNGNYRGICW